jgi:hypothetical protein
MAQAYFEEKSLSKLSDYDLYYNFRKLENNLTIAESSRFINFETKTQIREFYDMYVAELDRRVDSGELSLDDLEEIEEKVDIQLENEKKK